MKKPLVTVFGGSGFLGRYIVRLLAKNGFNIRVAVRDAEKAAFLSTAGEIGQISIVPSSISSITDLNNAIEGSSFVINCVGILYENSKRKFNNLHALAPGNIAKVSKRHRVKKLIHISALGASLESKSSYSQSKAMGEELVFINYPEATILRPSVVFGTDDSFINRFANLSRYLPILPYFSKVVPHQEGGGGTNFQPVYVNDIAKAILKIISSNNCDSRVYDIVGPKIYNMREILNLIVNYTERKPWVCAFPFWFGHYISLILQFLPNPLITPDQIKLLRVDNVSEKKLPQLKDLGIEPTPMESIIPTYLKRFKPYQQDKRIRLNKKKINL